MKTVCLLSLSMLLSAEAVRAEMPRTVSPELMSSWRAHLIDIDQSQTFETLSVADEFTRLPSSAYKTAGVYFITNSKGQVFSGINSGNSFDDPSGKQCIGEGYKLTKCDGTASDFCPYNNEYFKTCCDASYKYSKGSDTQASASIPGGDSSTTTPRLDGTVIGSSIGSSSELVGKAGKSACLYPQTYSDESCGGKYRCECKASSYPFSVCEEPQIKGDKCVDDRGTHYSSCACPVGRETAYGCETYYEAPCDTVCKTNYTDNCRNREGAQTPYGCETYFDDCPSKCEKAYPDNCRNRIDVPAPNGCKSYYSDCQSKCETAYTDNCHNRTGVDSSKFGCEKYFADCPSKCEKAYTDNCSKYTSVVDTCPGGATCTYYADCSSKVKSFTCPNGLEKLHNTCLLPSPVVYGDGTVSRELLSGKKPIAVVFDEAHRSAISLVEIKTDGKPAAQNQTTSSTEGVTPWANEMCNIPELESCPFSSAELCSTAMMFRIKRTECYANCAPDGKENTAKILAKTTCKGTYYAAEASYKFEPTGCSTDFCKAKEWFIPSAYEWAVIATNWSKLNSTLQILKSYNAMELRLVYNNKTPGRYYHSSTMRVRDNIVSSYIALVSGDGSNINAVRTTFKGYDTGTYAPVNGHRTRPAIKYNNASYVENCNKYTAVAEACPKFATCSYFYDCFDKIESFTCQDGLEKGDSKCLSSLPLLYGDGTVTKTILDEKPIGIVFDEDNRLAVALRDVLEDGSEGDRTLKWSNNAYDIPDLENCAMADGEDSTVVSCAVDGRQNTTAILNCGSACGGTPAATAANLYQPSLCTADFCKAGKWFLPSMRDLNNITLKGVNTVLEALAPLETKTMYSPWSSNEYDSAEVWHGSSSSYMFHYKKTSTNGVRPIVKY